MIIARARHLERLLAVVALVVGLAAWVFYLNEGLVLAHYDAKAHLVVARRVIDSLTPGWRQIGAVWLPLPHLVQILPTQVDVLYRTGAFGSLLSIVCFGAAAWALSRMVLLMTGSQLGAATAAALFVLNPNLLYIQSTPMTEPMLIAGTMVTVLWIYEWLLSQETPFKLKCALFLTAWTRYEAWPVLIAALAAVAYVLWRRGLPFSAIARRTWELARWPASAVALFLVLSRVTVGEWFVAGGFYESDPTYDAQAGKTLLAIWWGTHRLSGYVIEIVGLTMAAVVAMRAIQHREEAARLVTIALFAAAALPAVAFYEAHPFRIRYMVPLVSACALFCGVAVGSVRSGLSNRTGPMAAWALTAMLLASTLIESPPWRMDRPLIVEAQLDVMNSRERQTVTACLAPAYQGEKVLASMGSLAHYMQELSREGFAIADFIHEGNGALWELALDTGPAPHAGWMLVEEMSEGGDVLAEHLRRDRDFIRGMTKVCEGGGVSLYKRN